VSLIVVLGDCARKKWLLHGHLLTPVAESALVVPPVPVTKSSIRFSAAVRAKLAENRTAGVKPDSIRSLARAMAKGDQAKSESFKRSLFKWLAADEPHPSTESRALVAAVLDLDSSDLDDEESDPVADLTHAIRRIVREEVKSSRELEIA
jgi:hypothetical protein